ncbi:hypothetical protein Gorai_024679, partial [Gossypium raimondii]|nr:hypothetical protein [Gossypium raimondii]
DESIRTPYVGELDKRINEQDLRDNFAHGEIESIKMVLNKACAFVTYTTREGAEKVAEELSNKPVIKGLRLKLMWGKPEAPKLESETSEGAKQPATVAHSGMLPAAELVSTIWQSTTTNALLQYPTPTSARESLLPLHGFSKNGRTCSIQDSVFGLRLINP